MRTSDYYELNLVEGTDLVNPLVQDVPNYEKIDEVMHDNAVASVGVATELKSGTVHALTRVNAEASVFRFVATSRYDEGDTFTVDGIQVTGLLTDGTTLSDGAYVINANVLCCLVGTVLTLYTVPGAIATAGNALRLGGELPEYYGKASEVNTALQTANSAGTLANNLNSKLTTYVEGTLQPGETTLTLDDIRITTDSVIDIYTSIYGLAPTNVVTTTGRMVLSFNPIETILYVKIRVL